MRVLGLGFSDLSTAWSKDGKDYSPAHLASHLKTIILAERDRVIPPQPPVRVPARKDLPTLGTQAPIVAALDEAQASSEAHLMLLAKTAIADREARGEGDRYAECQPTARPAVDKGLLGKRLEIYCEYKYLDGDGSEPLWCPGKVVAVSDGSNMPKPPPARSNYAKGEAAMIEWDANEARGEAVTTSAQRLLPSKWNPATPGVGAWRFHVEARL